MRHTWVRALLGTTAAVVILLAVVVWPTSLGGRTSYVTTHGTSMEPMFHQGDLALVRPARSYHVGEVVAYRSRTLKGVTVLHRIVDGTAAGYTFKGDNNDFLDRDRPTEGDIIGRLWVRVPHGGRLAGGLRAGLPMLLGGLVLLGTGASAHRRRRRKRAAHLVSPPIATSSARSWRAATWALGTTAGACVAAGLLAFGQPATAAATDLVRYTQRGTFSYSASTPAGPVYPEGKVMTGDPVFRRLVNRLDVTFDYGVDTAATGALAGTIAVRTEVRSSNGWHRTLDTLPAQTFSGAKASTTVHLDLDRLDAMIKEVETLTGVGAGTTTVSVRPDAHVVGTLGAQRLEESFTPALDFQMLPLQLKLAEPDTQVTSTVAGTLRGTTDSVRRLEAFGVAVPAGALRLGSLGLGVPATLGAAAALLATRRRLRDEADRIELRHGHRIVPVSAAGTRNVIEVTSMQDLARLAEQYQALILHRQGQRGHDYLLQADGVVYRYRAREGRQSPRALS